MLMRTVKNPSSCPLSILYPLIFHKPSLEGWRVQARDVTSITTAGAVATLRVLIPRLQPAYSSLPVTRGWRKLVARLGEDSTGYITVNTADGG